MLTPAFEKTSESDLSTNRYKKQEKPWWMKEEENESKNPPGPTKSFMKKPKLTELASPKRTLGPTLESDEFLETGTNQARGNMPTLNLDTNTGVNRDSISASVESRKLKLKRSISFNDENGNQREQLASNEYDEEKFDEDEETSTAVSSPPQSRRNNSDRQNSRSSLKSSHTSDRSRQDRNGMQWGIGGNFIEWFSYPDISYPEYSK